MHDYYELCCMQFIVSCSANYVQRVYHIIGFRTRLAYGGGRFIQRWLRRGRRRNRNKSVVWITTRRGEFRGFIWSSAGKFTLRNKTWDLRVGLVSKQASRWLPLARRTFVRSFARSRLNIIFWYQIDHLSPPVASCGNNTSRFAVEQQINSCMNVLQFNN